MHVHTSMCLSTCAHTSALRSSFPAKIKGFRAVHYPYFILYAVTPLKTAFLYISSFGSTFLAAPFKNKSIRWARTAHSPPAPCCSNGGPPFSPGGVTQPGWTQFKACTLLRSCPNFQCLGLIFIAFWSFFKIYFYPGLWTFISVYWRWSGLLVFLLVIFR